MNLSTRLRWFRNQFLSTAIWIAVSTWIGWELRRGSYRPPSGWTPLLVALGVVTIGELLEIDLKGGRSTPVSEPVTLALFVVLRPIEVLSIAIVGFMVGLIVRSNSAKLGPRYRSTSRRLGALTVALGFFTAVRSLFGIEGRIGLTVLMAAAGFLELVVDTGASSLFIARVQRARSWPLWRNLLRNRMALHGALVSIAALMAISEVKLKEATFVLFLIPLMAARYAFRRYAAIHKTYIQTVRALSKVPELAGYAPEGHSVRVAELSTMLARECGLTDTEVEEVEFAAFLHDVGRLSFPDPAEIPESVAGTSDGNRVAEASAAIVAQTSYLSKVAKLIKDSDVSMSSARDEPVLMGSRILKVANDFIELTEQGGPHLPRDVVVGRFTQDSSVYDPEVIKALKRVVAHRSQEAV